MKDQVTNIEQSKRLIEMGVPAEKASMRWFQELEYESESRTWGQTNNRFIQLPRQEFPIDYETFYPAFTVADLLEIIPKTIALNKYVVYRLHIEICSSTLPIWCLFWGDDEVQIGWQERLGILPLLENAIEWLLLNGYKLEV